MRKINKSGEETPLFPFLLGLIITIAFAGVGGAVFLQWYGTTHAAEESFTDLIAKITAIQDQGKDTIQYSLPKNYILVSFNGKDFNGEGSCSGKIKVPKICGEATCLCVCKSSLQLGYEDACVENTIDCDTGDQKYSFYDSNCPSGVYRKGTENGIFSLYLERDGNILRFCSSKDCLPKDQQLLVDNLKTMIQTYKSCQRQSGDCTCPLDFSFITEGYAVNFYADKIELWDIAGKNAIYAENFETDAAVLDSEKFTDLISLYQFQEVSLPEASTGGVATPQYTNYHVISPSTDAIYSSGAILNEDQLAISSTLYKKGANLYFTTEDLTSLSPCNPQQEFLS